MADATSHLSTLLTTPIGRAERRILGVLIEKAFCTPEGYPLTLNSLVTGCNQKSNRDPVTNYDAAHVENALDQLKGKHLVTRLIPATGRTDRWRHELKECWVLDRPERAVIAELLLRGPQTEGELRGRASRMVDIASLEDLRVILEKLSQRGFVTRLSSAERKRGVFWSHCFYSADELQSFRESLETADSNSPDESDAEVSRAPGQKSLREEVAELRQELEALKLVVAELAGKQQTSSS